MRREAISFVLKRVMPYCIRLRVFREGVLCYNERHKKCYQPQPQVSYAFIRLGTRLLPFPSCSGMHVTDPSSFGQWLRQSHKRLDLTQAELARRAGCSKGTIRKLESG